MFQAIISAVLLSSEKVANRYALTRGRFGYKTFVVLGCTIIFLLMLLGAPFFFRYNPNFLSQGNLLLLGGVVVLGVLYNLLYFHGLKQTRVEQAEPLFLANGVFTILLAIIVYPTERNIIHIVLALVATLTIISINIRKHHFSMDKYSVMIIGAAVLVGAHNVLIKGLLYVYDPFTLYFVRIGLMIMIFIPMVGIDRNVLEKKKIAFLTGLGLLVVVKTYFIYWSYQVSGLVYTTLLLTFAPIVAMWGARAVLKETLHWKNLAATAVIILCIATSLFV